MRADAAPAQHAARLATPPCAVAIDAPTRSGSRETSRPRVRLGHPRRRNRQLREPVRPVQRTPVEPPLRLELRSLAADPHGMALRLEAP